MDYFKEVRNSKIELHKIYFWTATINKWQKLLEEDKFKEIIVDSLKYLNEKGKLKIYAFVIMPNHIHLVFECIAMNGKEMPHASFLKFTAHAFKKVLLKQYENKLQNYFVNKSNKLYEFWQRDALAFELHKLETAWQKIKYIHNNPIKEPWNFCEYPEDYKYSSAKFYLKEDVSFSFLEHIQEVF